jgi:hypothetical protein
MTRERARVAPDHPAQLEQRQNAVAQLPHLHDSAVPATWRLAVTEFRWRTSGNRAVWGLVLCSVTRYNWFQTGVREPILARPEPNLEIFDDATCTRSPPWCAD